MTHEVPACPPATASVRKFAVWWLRHKPFQVPMDEPIRFYSDFAGVTLFRDGPFQVQLFITHPNRTSPWHAHPNIESVEYGICGGTQSFFRTERNSQIAGLMMVDAGEFHEAGAGDIGGSFISLQKWINGVQPSSVELDWVGAPIDANHLSQLKN